MFPTETAQPQADLLPNNESLQTIEENPRNRHMDVLNDIVEKPGEKQVRKWNIGKKKLESKTQVVHERQHMKKKI